MRVELSITGNGECSGISEQEFERIVKRTIASAGKTESVFGLAITFVDSKRMAQLNKRRNGQGPTDVLSFALGREIENDGIIEIGDIFFCCKLLKEKAAVADKSLENHIKEMTVHACLHLLGYDHEDSDFQKSEMLTLQDRIINTL